MKCELCGIEVEIGMWPAEMCKGNPLNHGELVEHHPFKAYAIEHEGRRYVIDSIQAAQKVERETAAAARDGRGTPIVLRAFHYDKDGKYYDSHSFAKNPGRHPSELLRSGKLGAGVVDHWKD